MCQHIHTGYVHLMELTPAPSFLSIQYNAEWVGKRKVGGQPFMTK